MKNATIILFLLFMLNSLLFSQLVVKVVNDQIKVKVPPPNREWSIVATYSIPGKASGLAFDGTFLYSGIYGSNGDKVYKINPANGSYELLFSNPDLGDSFGLTWDGTYLWTIAQPSGSSNPALATQLDMNGTFLEQIELPDHYMSGIAYDNDDFWVATYYPNPGMIYLVDGDGIVLNQFQSPNEQPWDLCVENGNLWVTDYDAYMIYKMDEDGTVLESHPSENIKPSGIVYDGQYLWYVDGQLSTNSTLYKVDLGGAGTPVINVPLTEYDYGNVTIGDSAYWYVQINNIGTDNLVVESISLPGAAPVFSWFEFPATIPPGEYILVDLVYIPQEAISLEITATVHSSDPVNPEIGLTLAGHGVYPGPFISVPFTYHDYQNVRAGAWTRWYIEVKNLGDENLILNSVESNNPQFIVDEGFVMPFVIPVLATAEIGIWFNPVEQTHYEAILTIFSNDLLQNPFEVEVEGDGVEWEYPIGDILWYYEIDVSYDNSPKAIAPIADITGDEIADVIICSEDNFIRCFNGNSSGIADIIWERSVYAGSVYSSSGLTISEDINNDGYQDVIAGTTGGDRSIIALSGKNGEIIWKHDTHEYGEGGWVYQVDCRFDYNGDNKPDILAATGDDSQDQGPKRVYCLDALTGVSIWESPAGGAVFSAIGVADFTGDGIADALGGATNANETQGKVYGINGANGTTEWSYLTNGSSVWALEQLDDVNGDNVKDVIAGDFSGHYYMLDPVYGSTLFDSSIGPYIILKFKKLDDVNGDGYPDILFGHSGTNGIVIDGMTGENVWLQPLADKSWNISGIDDVSGDGINDVIIGTLYSNNYCYFLDGTNGSELQSNNVGTPVDALSSIPDITGDGSMEVVVGGRNGMVYCYSGGLNSWVGFDENNPMEDDFIIDIFPNPFSMETTLSFLLEGKAFISIGIYNIHGKLLNRLENSFYDAGNYGLTWNGTDGTGRKLPSGIYFFRLNVGNNSYNRRIVFNQ